MDPPPVESVRPMSRVRRQALEGADPLLHEVELDAGPVVWLPERLEPCLLSVGKRAEQQTAHHAEERDGCTDAERQRGDRQKCEAGPAGERPQGQTCIAQGITDHANPPRIPGAFLLVGDIAEPAPRFAERALLGQALGTKLSGFHIQVKLKFLAQLAFIERWPKKGPQSEEKVGQHRLVAGSWWLVAQRLSSPSPAPRPPTPGSSARTRSPAASRPPG